MKDIRENTEENNEQLEGRNAVIEALRAGRPVDRIFIQDGLHDGPLQTIRREASKRDVIVKYSDKESLDRMSITGKHQGVIARVAAYSYSTVEDILKTAADKGEAPFIFLLDGIEDPHNLGAIIRTACQAGAHGVIIPKNRAVQLTATVARTSSGALDFIKVAKVTNIGRCIDELKERGLWFACAEMDGELMYSSDLTGALGLVIGNEGKGVSRLVSEKCDLHVRIPMSGPLDSLNASVAAGILAYEAVRQRLDKAGTIG